MIYQKLLPASNPYVIYTSSVPGRFPFHKHHEIELIYSPIDTEIEITIGEEKQIIHGGELAVIGTLTPHSTYVNQEKCSIMVLEIGPVFLKEHFHSMSDLNLTTPKIILSADTPFSCISTGIPRPLS